MDTTSIPDPIAEQAWYSIGTDIVEMITATLVEYGQELGIDVFCDSLFYSVRIWDGGNN